MRLSMLVRLRDKGCRDLQTINVGFRIDDSQGSSSVQTILPIVAQYVVSIANILGRFR